MGGWLRTTRPDWSLPYPPQSSDAERRHTDRLRHEPEAGWPYGETTRPVLGTGGHAVAPTVFWGQKLARGAEPVRETQCSSALILMGDWCGPEWRTDTAMRENWGAEQEVTLLLSEGNASEPIKSVQGVVRPIDTSLLMGAPHYLHTTQDQAHSCLISAITAPQTPRWRPPAAGDSAAQPLTGTQRAALLGRSLKKSGEAQQVEVLFFANHNTL